MIQTPPHRSTRAIRTVEAAIEWVSYDRGGRKSPPQQPTYRSVPRFAADPNGTLGFWDVEIVFGKKPPTARTKKSIVTMSFVSSEAPRRLLRKGMRFELTEGSKVVATGEVR